MNPQPNSQLATPIPRKPPVLAAKHISFLDSGHNSKPSVEEKKQMLKNSEPARLSRDKQSQEITPTTGNNSGKETPSLSIKPEPNLRSCLLPPQDEFLSNESGPIHPSFVIEQDAISPNKHGLLSVSRNDTVTGTQDNEYAHSHVYTGLQNELEMEKDELKSPKVGSDKFQSPPPVTTPMVSPPLSEADSFQSDKLHLLIAVTGCISINNSIFPIIEKLFELYSREKLEIQVILSKSAELILLEKLPKFESLGVKVWFHDDGIKHYMMRKINCNPKVMSSLTPKALSQYVLPYDLQRWTDVLLLAPLSANTMAKMIHGLADNLITDLLHIWPTPQAPVARHETDNTVLGNLRASSKPIVAVLALTSSMYSHPITKKQLALLQETYPNMSILKPVEKYVGVDGKITMGGMRSWREVVEFVMKKLGPPNDGSDSDDENESSDDESEGSSVNESDIRNLSITSQVLDEHNKVASRNAILNSKMA